MFLFKLIISIKKLSWNKLPINPLFPFIISQYVSWWKTVKNKVPIIEYKIIKNKFSIKINILFFLNILMPVKKIEKGISKDIKPIDW